MDAETMLTDEERAYLLKTVDEAEIAEFYQELGAEEATAHLRTLIEIGKEQDRITAIEEAIDTRLVEESPDFLIAKEEVKRYFARIMEDDEAVEKARKRKARLEKKRDVEREVAFDIQAIRAGEQLRAIEPIAQMFKFKNQCHYLNACNSLASLYTLHEVDRDLVDPKDLARIGIGGVIREIDGLCVNVACARLLEAFIGSPHLYEYIASDTAQGKIWNSFYDDACEAIDENTADIPQGNLTEEQREQLREKARELEAWQGDEVKKACAKIAKNILTYPEIRAGEDVVHIFSRNRETLQHAADKEIDKRKGAEE